jgi:very-short-patch-repair endonuclease
LNPPLAEIKSGIEVLRQKKESEFEFDVGKMIIERGYKVIPQLQPLPNDSRYRIDLVVQGERNRIAVECDGDRHHGPEKWEYDQRREAQLRRAGWKFWRISGSAFYRNKENSLESLWQFLEAEGIEPILFTKESKIEISSTTDFKNELCKEDKNKKSNKETEKQDRSQSKSTPFTLTPQESQTKLFEKNKIPQLSTNWRVWLEISEWGKKTMAINEYWWGFANDISIRLKEKKEITPKQRDNMNKCWDAAFRRGFGF